MNSPRTNWIIKNCQHASKILDVGFAGSDSDQPGIFLLLRQTYPEKEIVGIDSNQIKVKQLNLAKTLVGDGKKLPFKNSVFGAVILAEVLEHQTDILPFLTEAFRVLKKTGVFLITTPNPYGVFRWIKHFLVSNSLSSRKNVHQFLGFTDHKMFIEPLSLINLLYNVGFSKVEYTSVHPSLPYAMSIIKEPSLPFWPFNRLGTYSCFQAQK